MRPRIASSLTFSLGGAVSAALALAGALGGGVACATRAEPSVGPATAIGVGDLVGPRTREHAARLAPTGARAATTPCRLLAWSPADPAPHPGAVDAALEALQAGGFDDVAVCLGLHPASAEGRGDAARRPLHGVRSPVPDREAHAAIAAWAGEVAERYDGDGRDDLPGLAHPVHVFRLGTSLAPGDLEPFDAYPALLAQVRDALRAASPEARLAPAPLRARDAPPGALAERLGALLAAQHAFDLWSVEASGTPAELDAWLGWLAERDPARPALVLGARTAPLAEGGAPSRCEPDGPERAALEPGIAESERCAVAAAFRDLLDGRSASVAWARARSARDLVAKVLVAASHGAARIEVASATDDPWWTHPALEAAAGLAAWSGLLDPDAPRVRPAFFALRQIAGLLEGRPRVTRVDGGKPDVRVYALRGPAGRAWVAWYEPPAFTGPGQLAPAAIVRVPLDAGGGAGRGSDDLARRLRAAPVVAEAGVSEADAEARPAEVHGGVLWLEVTPTPLVVRPVD